MLVPYLFVEARQSAHTKNQIGKLAPPNFDSEPLNSYEAGSQSFFLFNKTWRQSSKLLFIPHLQFYVTHVYHHLKGKSTFKTTCLEFILTLPYFQNILVKRLTMPPK